ncbi:MAG: ABC transporter ATP-binding protein [Planctomycetia bacterium]|uniref:ABC transporter ATP-binding protein n=1 Tax=Candidatus Kuenenia sp. TaxID=2499824 RepID=UPI001E058DA0|nr:ABC transporter ATP-binding protein [Planctomycetia bacterium]
MNNIAIHAEGLSKKFHIGKKLQRHKTFRDTLADAFTAPIRRAVKLLRGEPAGAAGLDETIWALRDISFEIKQGEAVGIIGRNGAGKSTLLKVLSRITEPTEGTVTIRGRISSLLEVGTGFHQELTGRENIFLNGAILGMKKVEIDKKFDEIVAFAEIEKFVDTPVKHYSSGMYLRLAFAVAAHLEPEVLIVDEVLAVGDYRFQKKCLNKMEDVGKKGRTVLFVSHNMPAVTRLCQRAILLDGGRLVKEGPSHEVVAAHMHSGLGTTAAREWDDIAKAPGGEVARLRVVRVRAEDGRIVDNIKINQPVAIEMEYEVLKSGYMLLPYYHFYNEEGINIFQAHDTDPLWKTRPRPAGRYVSTVWIPGNFLSDGMLFVSAGLSILNPIIHQFYEREAVAFQVSDSIEEGAARGAWVGNMGGVVRPLFKWDTQLNLNGSEKGKMVMEVK